MAATLELGKVLLQLMKIKILVQVLNYINMYVMAQQFISIKD